MDRWISTKEQPKLCASGGLHLLHPELENACYREMQTFSTWLTGQFAPDISTDLTD
jgi:hypothetical protein